MTNTNHTYPMINGFREMQAISFTAYYGMKNCIMKGLPYRCIVFTPHTPIFHMNRRQLLGILYHRMLEEVPSVLRLPLNERADRLSDLLGHHCIAIEASNGDNPCLSATRLKDLPELGALFRNLSNIVFEVDHSSSRKLKTSIEVVLTSPDKQLTGTLDVLQELTSQWRITEHKSCRIYENGVLKSKFNTQAHFYSQLVNEVHGTYPKEVNVAGLDGTCSLEPDKVFCKEIARDARRILAEYNSKRVLDDSQYLLTNATCDNCIDCAYQAYCQTYWSSFNEIEIDKPRAIRFRLIEVLQSQEAHKANLRVALVTTQANDQYTLGNYYPSKYAGLELRFGMEYIATKVTLNPQTNVGNFTADNILYQICHE